LFILFVLLGFSAASFSNTPLPKATLTKPNIPYFFLGTNNVNITVASATTSGGTWSGTGLTESNPYIFTPSGTATATISSSELATLISTKPYVTITTVSSSVLTCTGTGIVTFSGAITSTSSLTSVRKFTVLATSNIIVNSSINLTTTFASGNETFKPANIIFTSTNGNITINASITTTPSISNSTTLTTYVAGGNIYLTSSAGVISITTTRS
jgi:hypothetical protein